VEREADERGVSARRLAHHAIDMLGKAEGGPELHAAYDLLQKARRRGDEAVEEEDAVKAAFDLWRVRQTADYQRHHSKSGKVQAVSEWIREEAVDSLRELYLSLTRVGKAQLKRMEERHRAESKGKQAKAKKTKATKKKKTSKSAAKPHAAAEHGAAATVTATNDTAAVVEPAAAVSPEAPEAAAPAPSAASNRSVELTLAEWLEQKMLQHHLDHDRSLITYAADNRAGRSTAGSYAALPGWIDPEVDEAGAEEADLAAGWMAELEAEMLGRSSTRRGSRVRYTWSEL